MNESKVALILSGYLRSFKNNLPSLHENLLKRYDKVDLYIHITQDYKNDKYLNDFNFKNDIEYIKLKFNPVCMLAEPNVMFDSSNTIKNMWLKYYKLNKIKTINENIYGLYDLIIKTRPDVSFYNFDFLNYKIEKDKLYIPKDSKIDISKLKYKNDKYICDIIAFGTSSVMTEYLNLFEKIDNLIIDSDVPETLLYNYILSKNLNYELINLDYQIILSKCNVFGICGDSGSGKTTLSNYLKKFFSDSFVLECDRYHKWERGNENWQKFTHLNPEANYISKMNQDIFNLKIGNSIFSVDYDHKNGKFTPQKLIEPSDNTIVCGLHSLYTNDEHLYDLKIFIDTQDDLKTDWKIKRDFKDRGHDKKEILKQIDIRKNDYIKYILPQKEKSDLVINFYSENNHIKLKLFVSKKYEINHILAKLNSKKIIYNLCDKDEKYICINFEKYQDGNIWDNSNYPVFKNFYDYIIYFILNMK